MGRPYDPLSGLVTLLFVLCLGSMLFGAWLCYICMMANRPRPPRLDKATQAVLTPGYGLDTQQEPDMPYPTPAPEPRYWQEASKIAAEAWQGKSGWYEP